MYVNFIVSDDNKGMQLLQVSLCLCLAPVLGRPAARRLSSDSHDVLAGSDFLSVFMHRRMADRDDGPFEPHHINSVAVHHGVPLSDLVKPYVLSDIYNPNKYDYTVTGSDGDSTTPDVKTTTLLTEPTTVDDITTTVDFTPEMKLKVAFSDPLPTSTKNNNSAPKSGSAQDSGAQRSEEKVVVRVSSSVARHSHRTIETSTVDSNRDNEEPAKLVDENLVTRLVIQEQPTLTAVQRNEFAVEEAAPASSETVHDPKDKTNKVEEVEGRVEEVSLYGIRSQERTHKTLPVFEIHYSNPPEALVSAFTNKQEIESGPALKKKEFRQLSPYSVDSSVDSTSYHTRVATPTSDSGVQFYRDHYVRKQENLHQQTIAPSSRPPEEHQGREKQGQMYEQRAFTDSNQNYGQTHRTFDTPGQNYEEREPEQNYGQSEQNYGQPENNYGRQEKNYGIPEQNYGQPEVHAENNRKYDRPEQIYSQPEQNYEVDEAVSVMSNGRAHGVQGLTSTPVNDADQNKFGYVVEGRNFRKYQVEERTGDGFIVGEYGVVSHDDGSLRGVRYTADSNINPRLIYDALVKFLSLK